MMGCLTLILLVSSLALDCAADHGPFMLRVTSQRDANVTGYAYTGLTSPDQAGMFFAPGNMPPAGSSLFFYNATNSSNAADDVTSGGVLYTKYLPGSPHMYLSGNAGSNVAAAWFQVPKAPVDPTQGVWVGFDQDDKSDRMFIWGWDDSAISKIDHRGPPPYEQVMRWSLCDTYVANAWNVTLSWIGGMAPNNPSCFPVNVVMEMP